MTAIQHTPGPWKYKKCPCGDPICTRYRIHQADSAGMFSIDDAVLIVAAPDLVGALHLALTRLRRMPNKLQQDREAIEIGDAAIAKATQL